MLSRRHASRAAALLAALALVAPGTARAQSAGNQQYVDPLASTTPSSQAGAPASSAPQQAPAAPATASAPASSASPAPAAPASSSAQPTGTAAGTAASGRAALPFTGLDLWPAVAVGFGLLASGLAIRRLARRT